jgi:hypothetical protein
MSGAIEPEFQIGLPPGNGKVRCTIQKMRTQEAARSDRANYRFHYSAFTSVSTTLSIWFPHPGPGPGIHYGNLCGGVNN